MKISESHIEIATLQLLTANGYICWKFKDDMSRSESGYVKNPWKRNGISDLCVLLPKGRVLWLEIKTESGKQSKDQIEFQKDIESMGGEYHTATSAKIALGIVKKLHSD